jgi:hypothetical protein
MPRWIKFTLAGVVLALLGLGLAMWIASVRWDAATAQAVSQLLQAATPQAPTTVDFRDLARLPAPVARYFRRVLKDGQPVIRSARILQQGLFRLGESGERWVPFQAQQQFTVRPPGMVWDARMYMAPLLDVRVRDAYFSGQGLMQAKLLSLVPLVDERGRTELNAAALQRYLAEAVWFPTALLPGAGIRWSALDRDSALATLSGAGVSVSLEFRFNEGGEVTRVFAPGRHREVRGRYEPTPWAGYFRHYDERGGMRIPIEGEVEWQLAGRALPYWKGRVVDVEYEFAR